MNKSVKKITMPITYVTMLAGLAYTVNSCDLERTQLSEAKHGMVVLKNKHQEKFIGYDGLLDGMFVRANLENDYVKQIYYDLDGDSTTVEELVEMEDSEKPYRKHLVAKGFKPSRETDITRTMSDKEYAELNDKYKNLLKYHLCEKL